MQSQLPSPSLVWGVLPLRFESELTLCKLEICRLYGSSEDSEPAGGNLIGEREGREIIDELTGVLLRAVALDAEARQMANSSGRGVGRPREVMIPYLALTIRAADSR